MRSIPHPETKTRSWYANAGTATDAITKKLATVAPLYAQVSTGMFSNYVGDALEVVVFKCLQQLERQNRKHSFLGTFYLDEPKNAQGRFRKTEPPTSLSGRVTNAGPPDFYLFGFDSGPLCIECKNYREWTYPHHDILNKLIIKAVDLDATPVLISRRLHYTTITNFLEPAGIIAHESLYHYYPSEYADLAAQVRHRRSLGFTDVLATEDPHKRTVDFFQTHLPRIHSTMAARFQANKQSLIDYATNKINLAELYTAIDSPAGGKWLSPEDRAELFADYLLPNDDDDNT